MANKHYPFLSLAAVNAPLMDEIARAVERVVRSGRYVGGPEVDTFERALAEFAGTRYAVGCANGLDALRLIFRAYIELGQLRPGDEVIVPANTYIASILAVTDCGLTPVLSNRMRARSTLTPRCCAKPSPSAPAPYSPCTSTAAAASMPPCRPWRVTTTC